MTPDEVLTGIFNGQRKTNVCILSSFIIQKFSYQFKDWGPWKYIDNLQIEQHNSPYNSLNKILELGFAGIGIDSTVDLNKTLQKVETGFVQGNFDEKLLLQPSETILRYEIKKWLDTIQDTKGWVCGLGHGILKETSPQNVKLFIDTVRHYYA